MIKLEDLRIGNIINYKGNYSNYKGITPLTKHLFSYLLEVDDEWDLIDPIPLAEEWLLKFGFTKYTWCNDCAFIKLHRKHLYLRFFNEKWTCQSRHVKKDKDGYYLGENKNEILPVGKLKYVHQLQNLYFGLTGKELKLKQ